jgi:aldehyde dehydrogenase family protein
MEFVPHVIDGQETESADGGTITTGGLGDGWVVLPTVVENAPPSARICREEVFGPVVTIAAFDDDEDAIRSANDTRYGLNAMVFTRDLSRAHRASAHCGPERSGLTASSSATCAPRSAASATPASAARAAPSAASSSPSPRPWSCRSERGLARAR